MSACNNNWYVAAADADAARVFFRKSSSLWSAILPRSTTTVFIAKGSTNVGKRGALMLMSSKANTETLTSIWAGVDLADMFR